MLNIGILIFVNFLLCLKLWKLASKTKIYRFYSLQYSNRSLELRISLFENSGYEREIKNFGNLYTESYVSEVDQEK